MSLLTLSTLLYYKSKYVYLDLKTSNVSIRFPPRISVQKLCEYLFLKCKVPILFVLFQYIRETAPVSKWKIIDKFDK